MEKIKSFQIDHNILEPGFYISREDGNVITYDLRTRKPNAGEYMSHATMHSLEHMFATFARNSVVADKVVYFGPMGCQTGFYFLVKDLAPIEVYQLTKEILKSIIVYEGEVFGASAIECGNFSNLDLNLAKEEAQRYLRVLDSWTNMEFTYPS